MIPVRVMPHAPHTRISEIRAGRLVVRFSAAPVDGAVNLALVKLLAKALGVPAGMVRIAAGARQRNKSVLVEEVSPSVLMGQLRTLLESTRRGAQADELVAAAVSRSVASRC
ncbi:MAG: DUF167 domain-containing protein [Acidobacteriota bacterium]|nr:DUF167 domain-containing protein [Acidobacteriota bacterium]